MVKERLVWMDYLRAVAIVSVIFLHVTTPMLGRPEGVSKVLGAAKWWWVGVIYNSSVHFCVPAFVMLSGALLLGDNISLGSFLKRRYIRVVLPFIFWSLFYIYYERDRWEHQDFLPAIGYIIHEISNGVQFHMWYIYMILGVYLFIPILNKWIKTSTETEILYFLGIWLFTTQRGTPLFSFITFNINLTYFSGFVGYLVLGYYLSVKQFNTRHMAKIGAVLFIAAYIFTIFATYFSSIAIEKTDLKWYDYWSISTIVSSVGIFLFFKNIPFSKTTGIAEKLVVLLSKHSYGIYLVHMQILTYLLESKFTCWYINAVWGSLITTTLCLFISFTLVWLVSKIPYGRYVSG